MKEKYPDIHSAEELDRELLEEYLTYLATEAEGVNNYRMDLTRLRGILETIGKLYGYPHLESLFLTSDFPKQVQPKLKSYSDSELFVLMQCLQNWMNRLSDSWSFTKC